MVEYSHGQLDGSFPSYSVFPNAAKAARQFACDLRAQHPGWAGYPAIPGSPADSMIRAVWSQVCGSNTNQPPAPTQPFSGGQCPVAYNVVSQYTFKDSGIQTGQQGIVIGPLGGAPASTVPGFCAYGIGGKDANGNDKFYPFTPQYETTARLNRELTGFAIVSVTRVDGLPDNCGDPPLQYPPDSYLPPDSGDLTKPYPNPDPSNPNNKKWNFSIPFIWVDANFNVKIDVGGVTLKFDFGGVKIDLGNKSGDGSPGSFDGSGNNFPDDYARQSDAQAAKNAADAAKNAADAAKNAADSGNRNDPNHPRNDPGQQNEDPKTENDPKQQDGIDRLLFVDVSITGRPGNAKVQWGDGAPDVYYVGWFEFKSKGKVYPRIPIHFLSQRFEAPTGADGFGYTLYNGFTGKHTIVTARPAVSS